MSFGITDSGFVAKRLDDVLTDLRSEFTNTFGTTINLDSRGPFGQIIEIMADREAKLWELAEGIYNSQNPATAQGVGVDNALALVGVAPRKDAFESEAQLTFYGVAGTTINSGEQVARVDDSTVVFETEIDATIPAGSGQNEIQEITFDSLPDAGSFDLSYDGQSASGIPFNATAAQVQSALEGLSNIGAGNVSVSGDFSAGFNVEFTNNLAEQPVEALGLVSNLTFLTNLVTASQGQMQGGLNPNVTVTAKSTVTGPTVANAGTLSTLVTSVTGVNSVTNLQDADLGSEIETDAEAKLRRDQTLASPGHSTTQAIRADIISLVGVEAARIFENEDNIPDLSGRPASSYEPVVQGGDEDEILQVVLDTKAAGMETYGSICKILKDSQGFDKSVCFSRPTPVPIDLQVDIKTSAAFPANGLQQAADALLAFGDSLNIGDDVIVITQLLCSLNGITGILDVDIRIGPNTIPAQGSQAVTFTNNATNLSVNFASHPFVENNRVKFSNSAGALPTGVFAEKLYYVVNVTANSFCLAESKNGSKLGFFDTGSGVNTIFYGGYDDNINITDTERAIFDSSRILVASV